MQALQVYDNMRLTDLDDYRLVRDTGGCWTLWYQRINDKIYYYLCDRGIVNAVVSSQELAHVLWDSVNV